VKGRPCGTSFCFSARTLHLILMRILKCKAIMALDRAIFKYRVSQGMAAGKVLTGGISVPPHCPAWDTLSNY